MKQPVEVVSARREHLDRMGVAMGRAFQNEPNFAYIVEDPGRRQVALPWFFGTFAANLGFRYGHTHTTQDAAGGAIWLAPGRSVTAGGALRAGLLSMPWKFGWTGLKRSMEVSGHIERMRKRSAPEQHWYLLALGVDPSAQGRGIGSALLQPVLLQADAKGETCYLETFSEGNLVFYRKLGFEVINQHQFEKAGIKFWAMLRGPRR